MEMYNAVIPSIILHIWKKNKEKTCAKSTGRSRDQKSLFFLSGTNRALKIFWQPESSFSWTEDTFDGVRCRGTDESSTTEYALTAFIAQDDIYGRVCVLEPRHTYFVSGMTLRKLKSLKPSYIIWKMG